MQAAPKHLPLRRKWREYGVPEEQSPQPDVCAEVLPNSGHILKALQVLQAVHELLLGGAHAALRSPFQQKLQQRQRLVHVAPFGGGVSEAQLYDRLRASRTHISVSHLLHSAW